MKTLFDQVSQQTALLVTQKYSTSFSIATKLLSPKIRQDIYNIYGFVRLADEIVDSFHEYDKKQLLEDFETDLYKALDYKISLNPVLNAFQETVHKYQIDYQYIDDFIKSMKADLAIQNYHTVEDYNAYIYGSADVVGLMCLQVFVGEDEVMFKSLKPYAMKLGSAFQKVNFLRDLKDDFEGLGRSYFPNTSVVGFSEEHKTQLIDEIKEDFSIAYIGVIQLPVESRLGVFVAYKYYLKLLKKIERTPAVLIKEKRIRIPNYEKVFLLGKSYLNLQFTTLVS